MAGKLLGWFGLVGPELAAKTQANDFSTRSERNWRFTPTIYSDPVRLLRIFAVTVVVSQVLRFVSQVFLSHEPLARLVYYHFFNASVAATVLALSWTDWFREHWRSVMLAACCLILASVTAKNAVAGDLTEAVFVSLLLLVFGTALLVPWGFKWQALLNIMAIGDMALNDLLVSSGHEASSLHWFGLVFATALAQSAAWLMDHSREQDRTVQLLREREEQLRTQIEKRIQAEKRLQDNLAELQKIQEELVRAREDALMASRAKSEFLSRMSHEIRTPVNVILGMAELLADTPLTSEQQRLLDIMRSNVGALLALIADILDLARIESGRLELERLDFDLEHLIEQVATDTALLAHEKGLELIVRLCPLVPTRLVGDSLRLRQILVNLLNNAIKFTPSGEIVLTVSRSEAAPSQLGNAASDGDSRTRVELHFTVADTGVGIPKDSLGSIFESFTQADSSTTRRYGGAGLGLAIVKRLVELQGGSIWVESEVGKGSTFHITLPFELQHTQIRHDVEPRPVLNGKRILVIDDNQLSRQVIKDILGQTGAAITEASNAEQALVMLEHSISNNLPYHLLIVDGDMVPVDGFAVVENLNRRFTVDSDKLRASRVIIMVTTSGLTEQVRRAQSLGIDTYVVKPIKRSDLLSAVDLVLGTSSYRRVDSVTLQTVDKPQVISHVPSSDTNRRIRVLLVEDSEDNRFVVSAYLKGGPYDLDFAENGEEAVNRFIEAAKKDSGYDVVLMDLQMPVVDGYTAVQRIRQWEKSQSRRPAFIIALTASALREDLVRCLEVGCDRYVAKPVRKKALLELLDEAKEAIQDSVMGISSTQGAANGNVPTAHVDSELIPFVPVFLARKREDIAKLIEASEEGDYEAIRAIGHKIKGEGRMMGFEVVGDLAEALEKAAEERDLNQIRSIIKNLSEYLNSVRAEPC